MQPKETTTGSSSRKHHFHIACSVLGEPNEESKLRTKSRSNFMQPQVDTHANLVRSLQDYFCVESIQARVETQPCDWVVHCQTSLTRQELQEKLSSFPYGVVVEPYGL